MRALSPELVAPGSKLEVKVSVAFSRFAGIAVVGEYSSCEVSGSAEVTVSTAEQPPPGGTGEQLRVQSPLLICQSVGGKVGPSNFSSMNVYGVPAASAVAGINVIASPRNSTAHCATVMTRRRRDGCP